MFLPWRKWSLAEHQLAEEKGYDLQFHPQAEKAQTSAIGLLMKDNSLITGTSAHKTSKVYPDYSGDDSSQHLDKGENYIII